MLLAFMVLHVVLVWSESVNTAQHPNGAWKAESCQAECQLIQQLLADQQREKAVQRAAMRQEYAMERPLGFDNGVAGVGEGVEELQRLLAPRGPATNAQTTEALRKQCDAAAEEIMREDGVCNLLARREREAPGSTEQSQGRNELACRRHTKSNE